MLTFSRFEIDVSLSNAETKCTNWFRCRLIWLTMTFKYFWIWGRGWLVFLDQPPFLTISHFMTFRNVCTELKTFFTALQKPYEILWYKCNWSWFGYFTIQIWEWKSLILASLNLKDDSHVKSCPCVVWVQAITQTIEKGKKKSLMWHSELTTPRHEFIRKVSAAGNTSPKGKKSSHRGEMASASKKSVNCPFLFLFRYFSILRRVLKHLSVIHLNSNLLVLAHAGLDWLISFF